MSPLMTSRSYLLVEMIAIYVGVPALVYLWPPQSLFPLLWVLALICSIMLLKEKDFKREELWVFNPVVSYQLLAIQAAITFILAALLLSLLAPELLFSLVKNDPLLWLAVMLLYPLLSVYPQELIYRSFFFHRYRTLIPHPLLMAGLNALLFGYMHIIFHNWIALLLTTLGGLYFAILYQRSHSLLFVSAVHALYGNLLFTLGLGQYFYHGSIETIAGTFRI
ncbi:MAG: CPBP family intramembrane metalloprotease [Sulfurovum sp.]|nr:CPBP family intramembrane metalloprotease [Sulfurovum sp.]